MKMARIASDTFPKSISVQVNLPDTELRTVDADAAELHQLLLNLCVNARDAMPNGGRLALGARNVTLDQAQAKALGGAAGAYVLITVADTGAGIAPEDLPRILEPFFTTKEAGKGTGLGLSTVNSIVKRYNGVIDVGTGLGQGSEFRIFLPVIVSPKVNNPMLSPLQIAGIGHALPLNANGDVKPAHSPEGIA